MAAPTGDASTHPGIEPGIEPRLDDRVGELRVGPWEGVTEDEIGERWPEEWRRWRNEPHSLCSRVA